MRKIKVLKESQDWKVIDKFAGVDIKDLKGKLAHRLDKATSGCLLIAKNEKALAWLRKQFKDREVKKEYWALVYGKLEPREGVIKLPIEKTPTGRWKFKVGLNGRMAETKYKVDRYVGNYTWVKLWPKTGRTHQLRVHLSHWGYPIVGDEKYASKNQLAESKFAKRMQLHASSIEFRDLDGNKISIKSELPFSINSDFV